MTTKIYPGVKIEGNKVQQRTYSQHQQDMKDKIVWMQMLEKMTLQENAVSLIDKIRKYYSTEEKMSRELFNSFVEETAKEVKHMEFKKMKEKIKQ